MIEAFQSPNFADVEDAIQISTMLCVHVCARIGGSFVRSAGGGGVIRSFSKHFGQSPNMMFLVVISPAQNPIKTQVQSFRKNFSVSIEFNKTDCIGSDSRSSQIDNERLYTKVARKRIVTSCFGKIPGSLSTHAGFCCRFLG